LGSAKIAPAGRLPIVAVGGCANDEASSVRDPGSFSVEMEGSDQTAVRLPQENSEILRLRELVEALRSELTSERDAARWEVDEARDAVAKERQAAMDLRHQLTELRGRVDSDGARAQLWTRQEDLLRGELRFAEEKQAAVLKELDEARATRRQAEAEVKRQAEATARNEAELQGQLRWYQTALEEQQQLVQQLHSNPPVPPRQGVSAQQGEAIVAARCGARGRALRRSTLLRWRAVVRTRLASVRLFAEFSGLRSQGRRVLHVWRTWAHQTVRCKDLVQRQEADIAALQRSFDGVREALAYYAGEDR